MREDGILELWKLQVFVDYILGHIEAPCEIGMVAFFVERDKRLQLQFEVVVLACLDIAFLLERGFCLQLDEQSAESSPGLEHQKVRTLEAILLDGLVP